MESRWLVFDTLEDSLIEVVRQPESCVAECVQFRSEVKFIIPGRSEEYPDCTSLWEIVATGRSTCFPFVE